MNVRLFTLAIGGLCGLAALAISPSAASQGLEYTAIDGCRVLDTRKWNGTTPAAIPAARAVEFHLSNEFGTIASQGGDPGGCPAIPADAAAFAVTLTAVSPVPGTLQPERGYATLLPWDAGTWVVTGATPAGNNLYSYDPPPFTGLSNLNWDYYTFAIANTTIVKACESCSYHARLYTLKDSHFVVDVVGVFTEISAVQNLTDAGLLDNDVGDIAQNNGDLRVDLNADLLDGSTHRLASAATASNLDSGTLATARYSARAISPPRATWPTPPATSPTTTAASQATLNADLLDGKSSADFVAATGDTMTGPLLLSVPTGAPWGYLRTSCRWRNWRYRHRNKRWRVRRQQRNKRIRHFRLQLRILRTRRLWQRLRQWCTWRIRRWLEQLGRTR